MAGDVEKPAEERNTASLSRKRLETAMATLTIRKLDDEVKRRLRIRAAKHGRSMEEEARWILAHSLKAQDRAEHADAKPEEDFVGGIRRIVESVGGFDDVVIPPREKDGRRPLRFKE